MYNSNARERSFDKKVFNYIIWDIKSENNQNILGKRRAKNLQERKNQCCFIKKISNLYFIFIFFNSPLNLGKEFCLLGFSAIFECGCSCH